MLTEASVRRMAFLEKPFDDMAISRQNRNLAFIDESMSYDEGYITSGSNSIKTNEIYRFYRTPEKSKNVLKNKYKQLFLLI